MSSELDNDNSESLHFSTPPEKIDPRDTPLLDDRNGESNQGLLDNEEKGDPPKLEDLVSSGSSTTNAGHFYRDVYSSSPEEDIDLEAAAGEDEDKFIEIFVSEPHKVGEGISCYMAYKVSTKTNLKIFRRESFSVTRRFSDFLGKYEGSYRGPKGRGSLSFIFYFFRDYVFSGFSVFLGLQFFSVLRIFLYFWVLLFFCGFFRIM